MANWLPLQVLGLGTALSVRKPGSRLQELFLALVHRLRLQLQVCGWGSILRELSVWIPILQAAFPSPVPRSRWGSGVL